MKDNQAPSEKFTEQSIDRRQYLIGAGAAVGSLGVLNGITGSVKAEEYETITVSAGETFTKRVGTGETWENKLIDISAPGASYSIHANGTNWTIRNIGIKGIFDRGSGDPFTVRDTSSSGQSVIENVYLGDGAADDFQWNTHQVTGIYVHADHAGDLLIKNVHVNEFRDNAIYASDPGHPEWDYSAYGTVRIEDSFARNGGFNFRLSTEGSYCDNCVSVITNSYKTGGPRLFTDYFSRGVEFRNCDAAGGGNYIGWSNGTTSWPQYTENSDVQLTGCKANVTTLVGGEHSGQWTGEKPGPNPRNSPEEVDGVPLTPEEAASGTSGSSGGSTMPVQNSEESNEDPFLVAFVTDSDSKSAKYALSSEERLDPTTAPYKSPSGKRISGEGETVEEADGTYSVSALSGGGYGDAYEVSGPVTDVTVEQSDVMWIELDGEEVTEQELIERTSDAETETLENTLLVDGMSSTGSTRYELSVSGTIEKSTLKGASIDDGDTIESGHVTGSVGGWRDAFKFSGDLEELTVDGAARVYVNGDQVDPSKYGDELPHILTIVGNGTGSTYEATVDGTIDTLIGEPIDNAELSSDTSVTGTIKRDVHRFRFSGELIDFTFTEGGTQVYVDDQRIDPAEYDTEQERPPHALVIDGSNTDEPSTYSFTTDGDVVKSSYRDASIDDGDTIDGTTVRGGVANWIDAYWFDGNIVDFNLAGDAAVDVEYNARE